MPTLAAIAIMLFAAIVAVRLSSRFGFGAVLGYLVAGMAMGPHGLKLIGDPSAVLHVAEFGVVMLLFIIGLELKPQRLWVMRRQVFGLGGLQVVGTTALFGLIGWSLGFNPAASGIAGLGLALSSTAFVLPILGESGEISAAHGRSSFAILLFQDIAVIPAMALIPLMGVEAKSGPLGDMLLDAGRAIAAILLVILLGRQVVRHFLRIVAETRNHELFVITALFIVLGTAALMEAVGLSMSLGAFLAGVLLADSEYRHELQADIEPFKGVMLGLFFMAVGMAAYLPLLVESPGLILGLTAGFMAVKIVIIYLLGRYGAGLDARAARAMAFVLPQGGEFAFVLYDVAAREGAMTDLIADYLIVAVTLSMAATPLVHQFNRRFLDRWLSPPGDGPRFDTIETPAQPVVIAGFGRFGQIVSRTLRARSIPFTAIEVSATQVDFVRRFGNKVYYGDATRLDILRSAEIGEARAFVLAIDDPEASVLCAEVVRRNFPDLPIYARVRNRQHAFRLLDLGVTHVVRETFASSLELTEDLLQGLGFPAQEAAHTIATFRQHDEAMLLSQHAAHADEAALVQSAQEASEQLRSLFESDPTGQAAAQAALPAGE
ncbi:MAG: cation:proton antiporter [Alphaproteobacteria bacterium]|nr:cation:proton antiporter [Alphaproteobacteria bacterium]